MNRYEIDVKSMCFTDILGEAFTLPYSDRLAEAVLLINEACSIEVKKREEYILEEFVVKKYQEIKTTKDSKVIRDTLLEIARYYKK